MVKTKTARRVFLSALALASCSRPSTPTKPAQAATPSLGATQGAAQPPLVPVTAPVEEPDGWKVETSTSEMDDVRRTVMILKAEDEIRGFGGIAHRPALIVRCTKHDLEAYVATGTPANFNFGDEGYAVRLRFDKDKPINQSWNASQDHGALFTSKPRSLVDQIAKAELLRFEFTPLAQTSEVVIFKVVGFAKHKDELKDCLTYKAPKRTPSEDEDSDD